MECTYEVNGSHFLHGLDPNEISHKHQFITVVCVGMVDIPKPNQNVDHDVYIYFDEGRNVWFKKLIFVPSLQYIRSMLLAVSNSKNELLS